jgi:5-methylcytosine-specific restriction endonuclease McrA
MSPRQFRSTIAWQNARARVVKYATHCGLCGLPLVPDAPPRTRWSTSVDHRTPLHALNLSTAEGRALAVNPANLVAAHYGCNSRRGSRTAAATRRVPRIFGPSDMNMRRTQRW